MWTPAIYRKLLLTLVGLRGSGAVEIYARIYSCHNYLFSLLLCYSTTSTAIINSIPWAPSAYKFKRYSTDVPFLCQMVTQAIVLPLTVSHDTILYHLISVNWQEKGRYPYFITEQVQWELETAQTHELEPKLISANSATCNIHLHEDEASWTTTITQPVFTLRFPG